MIQNDWSQFIPDIVSAIIVALILGFFNGSLKARLKNLTGSINLAQKLLIGIWIFTILIFIGITISGEWFDMNSKQMAITIAYFSTSLFVVVAVFLFYILPLIKTVDDTQQTSTSIPPTSTTLPSTQTPEAITALAFSNTQLTVTSSGDVILRTVISSLAQGNRKPIKILLPTNFTVVEKYNTSTKRANIYQAKPSSTRADIIVLIDVSGSMSEQTNILNDSGENLTKLEVAKDAVSLFFDDLASSDIASIDGKPSRVAFLPFTSQGVNFLVSDDGDIWFSTTPESKSEVHRAVNTLVAKGDTPLYDAIFHALDIIQDSGEDSYKLLFCLTDGLDTSSGITIDMLQAKLVSSNIPVITVGYGLDGEYDGAVLDKIAYSSGAGKLGIGSFINILPKDLSGVFTRLATDLNNIYEIRWRSAFPKPGNLIFATITAKYQVNTGQTVSATETRTYLIPIVGK